MTRSAATSTGRAGAGHTNGSAASAQRWTTADLASRLGADLRGPGDVSISRIDALDRADGATLSFIRDAKFASAWAGSAAGAAIVSRGIEVEPAHGRALLFVDDADHAMIALLEMLTPETHRPSGRHPSAAIDPTARVDASANVGPNVAIGPRTIVGAGATLHPGVALGADVTIGPGAELRAGVVVEDRCVIGARTRVHANAVIGADGFGYRPAPGGRGLIKIPHAGNVEIGDDVEIGANTNIDRGKFGATVIGSGTKIDNLVQIGHNCRVGRSCVICGAVGLSGSVTVGDGAVLAGGVGVADNLTIGAGAKVGARSGVMNDVPPGEEWVGYPAMPRDQTMRIVVAQRQLPEVLQKVKRLLRGAAGGAGSGSGEPGGGK